MPYTNLSRAVGQKANLFNERMAIMLGLHDMLEASEAELKEQAELDAEFEYYDNMYRVQQEAEIARLEDQMRADEELRFYDHMSEYDSIDYLRLDDMWD